MKLVKIQTRATLGRLGGGCVCVCVWSHLIVESLYQQWWQSALWLGSVRSALQLKPHTVKPPPPVTLTCQMFSFSPRRSPGAQQPLSWWNAAFREERYDVICAHKHHREGAEEMGMWHKKEKQTKQKQKHFLPSIYLYRFVYHQKWEVLLIRKWLVSIYIPNTGVYWNKKLQFL